MVAVDTALARGQVDGKETKAAEGEARWESWRKSSSVKVGTKVGVPEALVVSVVVMAGRQRAIGPRESLEEDSVEAANVMAISWVVTAQIGVRSYCYADCHQMHRVCVWEVAAGLEGDVGWTVEMTVVVGSELEPLRE
jgi:hypothetical protein